MARERWGSIQRHDRGVYYVRWTEHGRQRRKTVRGTMADARAFLAAQEVRVRSTVGDVPSEVTWGAYWEGVVWPSCADLAVKTRDDYEWLWERAIAPQIGSQPLADATWAVLQHRVIDGIAAPSTQRKASRLLSKICNMAVRDGILAASPCSTRFDFRRRKRREKKLVDTLTVSSYMKEIRGIKYEAAILCMIGGGLRVEEALALRWTDIEQIEIMGRLYLAVQLRRTLTSARGKSLSLEMKTEESAREMIIGEPFASRIAELAEERGDTPLVPSGAPADPENPAAEYTSPSTVTHNYKRWCEQPGKALDGRKKKKLATGSRTYIRPGDMRTCWSTMQAEAKSPDSLISMAMGHTDGTTRGSHYLKTTRRALSVLADNLEDAIKSAAEDAESLS